MDVSDATETRKRLNSDDLSKDEESHQTVNKTSDKSLEEQSDNSGM